MYNGGYQALAAAIVLQAIKDYIQLTRIYKQLVDKKTINPRIQEERQELKQFFNNEDFRKALSKTIANLIKEDADLSHFSIQDANNREDFKEIRAIVDTLIDEGMREKEK